VTVNGDRGLASGGQCGNLIVVSAPSGAGKTSLVQALAKSDPQIEISVSHTTRPPRAGETDGVHYHFVEQTRFDEMIAGDGFLEYATVFGNRYGTSRAEVERRINAGYDVILEIDVQGASQIRNRMQSAIGVFILPPARDTLAERLAGRAQDSAEVIARRLNEAIREISHYREFDYLVVNDRFADALADLTTVVRAQRLGRRCQTLRHGSLLASLLASNRPLG